MKKRYWFAAKRYGWGWGMPSTWEGWVVLVGFILLMVVGSLIFPPDRQIGWFMGYTAALVVVLLSICWKKGEPPRWRWGG